MGSTWVMFGFHVCVIRFLFGLHVGSIWVLFGIYVGFDLVSIVGIYFVVFNLGSVCVHCLVLVWVRCVLCLACHLVLFMFDLASSWLLIGFYVGF